jgi:hypothetical protein
MPITQQGTTYGINIGPGQGDDFNLTNPSLFLASQPGDAEADNTAISGAPNSQPSMSVIWYFAAVVLILVALNFAVEREGSRSQFHLVHIGVWNWIVITLMAVLGIIAVKTIFNKYQVPGLTTLINAA